MTRRVTSHDVARLVGVSQPTVSRALREDRRVAEATRRRVRDAATTLGYVPSTRGRSLSTRATGQVGVVVSELANPFYMETIAYLYDALDRAGYRMVVVTEPADRPMAAERLVDGAIDGAILTTTLLGSALPHELARRGFPFVLLNRRIDALVADTCLSANAQAAARIGELLADLGHTRVGAIFGAPDTSTGRDREAGFRHALAERGIALPASAWRRGAFSFDAGYRGLLELLDADEPPTAVFCGNDVIAVGALNAARKRDVAVPDELTIVGFDDVEMARWELVALTTARQPMPELCRAAVDLLLARLSDPDRAPQLVELPAKLVERGTHAPLTTPSSRRRP
jgi:LacI family transcriptional regulator